MNPGSGRRSLLPLPPGSPAVARSLSPSLARSLACACLLPPSPRQSSSQPWGPGARRLANGEGSPSAPRSPGGEQRRPGYAGGGTYPATQIVIVIELLSYVLLFATPWTIACQALLSKGFPREEYWNGLSFLLQGIFLTQGSNQHLPHWQANSLPWCHLGSPS